MIASKFLYECWVFIKKMNQNSSITTDTLLSTLAQLTSCRSMHGTLFYRMVYDDKFKKLKGIFKQVDHSLNKITQSKGMAFHVNHLKVLLMYQMPYESSLLILLPLLNEPVSRVNLIDICSCLHHSPRFRTETFDTLISRIFELVEQELDNTIIMDKVFLLTVLKVTSRSLYRVPPRLQKKLNNLLNSSLQYLENKQIILISNMMMPKSTQFWCELMKRESAPIFQKIAAKRYLKDIYGVIFDDAIIPGKAPENCKEAEEAIACIQSTMHKQPFMEIFPQNLFNQTSQKSDVWRLYANYLFYHIKKDYERLPQETVDRLVSNLFNIIQKNEAKTTLAKVNLIKLYAVLFDISRDTHSIASKHAQFLRVYSFIRQSITPDYLAGHAFEEYQFGELQYLAHLLMYQMVLIARGDRQMVLDVKIIQQIVKSRRERHKNNFFQTLEEMLGFINRGRVEVLKKALIITKTPATEPETEMIKKVIPKSLAEKFGSDCQLYKKVIVNPNVEVQYALVSPTSQLVWALDYDPILMPTGKYLQQSALFPLNSAWKSALLQHQGCSYYIPG